MVMRWASGVSFQSARAGETVRTSSRSRPNGMCSRTRKGSEKGSDRRASCRFRKGAMSEADAGAARNGTSALIARTMPNACFIDGLLT